PSRRRHTRSKRDWSSDVCSSDLSLDGIDNNDGLGKDYLGLNANERSMLQGLSDARESGEFDRLIVIINSASPLEMEWLDDYKVRSEERRVGREKSKRGEMVMIKK